MIADSERREVAAKLREISPYYNSPGTIPKLMQKPAAEYLTDLARALGYSPKNDVSRIDFQNRLADLIEPDDTKVKCVAEVKVDGERLEELVHDAAVELTGIDRDALLALADEIDRKSNDGTVNPDPMRPLATSLDLFGYARRIREALGVSE